MALNTIEFEVVICGVSAEVRGCWSVRRSPPKKIVLQAKSSNFLGILPLYCSLPCVQMPPRIARSSIQGSKPVKSRPTNRNPKKATKRAINAFAIAQFENPEKLKIRKGRLGELEPSANRKRSRYDEDEEDEDEDGDEDSTVPKRRKNRSGDDSFDEGSDSEGNTWQMGHVDDDDDEDIDSDEAFGESDEERFEGFTFRGSSKPQKGRRKKENVEDEESDIDMDDNDESNGDDEEDDLGEDAIDLATALDQYEEDEAEQRKSKKKRKKAVDENEWSSSEDDDLAGSDASELSSNENEEDGDDEDDRQAQLSELISSLATQGSGERKGRRVEQHESMDPDEFAVMRKVDFSTINTKSLDAERGNH